MTFYVVIMNRRDFNICKVLYRYLDINRTKRYVHAVKRMLTDILVREYTMDDQLLQHGLGYVDQLLGGLEPEVRVQLQRIVQDCFLQKNQYAAVVGAVGASALCRTCRGQCCMNGKYRLTLFDALMFRLHDQPLRADFTHKPLCPFGTSSGCLMEPAFRPLDCILFICETVDDVLSEDQRAALAVLEERLRHGRLYVEKLLQQSLATPVLLWAEKL